MQRAQQGREVQRAIGRQTGGRAVRAIGFVSVSRTLPLAVPFRGFACPLCGSCGQGEINGLFVSARACIPQSPPLAAISADNLRVSPTAPRSTRAATPHTRAWRRYRRSELIRVNPSQSESVRDRHGRLPFCTPGPGRAVTVAAAAPSRRSRCSAELDTRASEAGQADSPGPGAATRTLVAMPP